MIVALMHLILTAKIQKNIGKARKFEKKNRKVPTCLHKTLRCALNKG
jgi:hypothetical protein